MYAATGTGPVAYLPLVPTCITVSTKFTVIASPSIFANGVDHFRSVLEDVGVKDEDHRIAHRVLRLGSSHERDWLHLAAL
jgi:hypothetical protein